MKINDIEKLESFRKGSFKYSRWMHKMIGLQRGIVKLVPHRADWRAIFEKEAHLLREVIGHLVISIQHIGSTAIPDLCAKPVIDIAAAVNDLSNGLHCIPLLTGIGYEYRGEAGVPDRIFFVKGSEACRTHYLHVEELNGNNWKNHILFRDYLLSCPNEVSKYANLKQYLAAKHPDDRDAYTAGKDHFIEEIIKVATRYYQFDKTGCARIKPESYE